MNKQFLRLQIWLLPGLIILPLAFSIPWQSYILLKYYSQIVYIHAICVQGHSQLFSRWYPHMYVDTPVILSPFKTEPLWTLTWKCTVLSVYSTVLYCFCLVGIYAWQPKMYSRGYVHTLWLRPWRTKKLSLDCHRLTESNKVSMKYIFPHVQ